MLAPGYYRHDPPPPLVRYVDHFWILEQFPAARTERLVPDGTAELIFNLGIEQRLYHDLHPESGYRTFRESWLSGSRRIPITIGSPGPSCLIGVHFRPCGAFAFFTQPMTEFSDRVTDLDAIWGAGAGRIRDQLGNAGSAEERFHILTKALLARLQDGRPGVEAVRAALDGGPVSFTDRTLRRRFRELIGQSPKTVQRLLRFQRIVEQLDTLRSVNWSALAIAEGLYDQAHLIREFREFAGLTPTEYLVRKGTDPIAVPA